MDKITMARMEFYGYHGVFPEENKLGQRFYVDVELFLPLAHAGGTDNINDTINYAEVYAHIRELAEQRTYRLIEALAEGIAAHLLKTYPKLKEITVRVVKPHPPFDIHFAGVTVEVRRKRLTQAYIALGSNIGDRERHLSEAIRLLETDPDIRVTGQSSVYDTEPVGYVAQDTFLNMVLRVETGLDAEALFARMIVVEQKLGRKRDIRWGPRTIDLDLLLFGDSVIDLPELTVPHPSMLERPFVLIPLLEIAGDLALPGVPSLSRHLATLAGKEGVRLWTKTS